MSFPLTAPESGSWLTERSLFRSSGAAVVLAPAKVNLFLELRGKRPDGYHELETLLVAVNLFDTLEVTRRGDGELTLACDAPGVPADARNLVVKAALALRTAAGVGFGAAFRLVKRVPHAAGLGGGSSDAASALLALNHVWDLGLSLAKLREVAAEVGSDVPAFLCGPAAWCTGRGEVAEPAAVGAALHLVIVKPEFGLSTAAVYGRARVPATPHGGAAVRAALASGDANAVAETLFNRLDAAAIEAEPRLTPIRAALAACGPLAVIVSGSGSCLAALARDRDDAVRVARRFDEATGAGLSGVRVWVVRTLGGPAA